MDSLSKLCKVPHILVIIFVFFASKVMGQEMVDVLRKHEFSIQVDNDAFAFTHFDRYYTNGVILGYAHFLAPNRRFKANLVQQIYTPEKYTSNDLRNYDRPYAGVLYGKASYQCLFRRGWVEGGMLIGKIGPGSKAEDVQVWYHRAFGFPQPNGWNNQIKSGGLVNLQFKTAYNVWGTNGLDLWLSGRAAMGNYDQSLQIGPKMRIGNFQSHYKSYFSGARVGKSNLKEFYLLLGTDFRRVYKNATVQGVGEEAKRDYASMDPAKVLNEYYGQLVLGFLRVACSYRFSYRTKETAMSKGQLLGSLRFSYSF